MILRKCSGELFYGATPIDHIRQKHAGQKAYLFYRVSFFENNIEVLKKMTSLRIFRIIIWFFLFCIFKILLLSSFFQLFKRGKFFIGPNIFSNSVVIRYLFLKTFHSKFQVKHLYVPGTLFINFKNIQSSRDLVRVRSLLLGFEIKFLDFESSVVRTKTDFLDSLLPKGLPI